VAETAVKPLPTLTGVVAVSGLVLGCLLTTALSAQEITPEQRALHEAAKTEALHRLDPIPENTKPPKPKLRAPELLDMTGVLWVKAYLVDGVNPETWAADYGKEMQVDHIKSAAGGADAHYDLTGALVPSSFRRSSLLLQITPRILQQLLADTRVKKIIRRETPEERRERKERGEYALDTA